MIEYLLIITITVFLTHNRIKIINITKNLYKKYLGKIIKDRNNIREFNNFFIITIGKSTFLIKKEKSIYNHITLENIDSTDTCIGFVPHQQDFSNLNPKDIGCKSIELENFDGTINKLNDS